MTVEQLIKKLSKVDPKLEVRIQGVDPTDWTYYNEIEGVRQEKVFLDEEDKLKTKVLLIDAGCF